MLDVITPQAESTYRAEIISDTPIFNALAAATAAWRSPSHREPAPLSRSCVMPRSPMGGRHRRLSTLAEHTPGAGRHRLVTAGHA